MTDPIFVRVKELTEATILDRSKVVLLSDFSNAAVTDPFYKVTLSTLIGFRTQITVESADILALKSTPLKVLDKTGISGEVIIIDAVYYANPGGTIPYTMSGTSTNLLFKYDNGGGISGNAGHEIAKGALLAIPSTFTVKRAMPFISTPNSGVDGGGIPNADIYITHTSDNEYADGDFALSLNIDWHIEKITDFGSA